MQVLARKEQEHLVLTFKKDYGRLLKEYSHSTENNVFKNEVVELYKQIKSVGKIKYFEEDMLDSLINISESLSEVMLSMK